MPKLSHDDADALTTNLPLTGKAYERQDQIRALIAGVMKDINDTLPDCRELSLVNTKLEEAMFFANAGIARNQDRL